MPKLLARKTSRRRHPATESQRQLGIAGNDSLRGGNGDDVMHRGLGDNTLNSGSGSDRFVLATGEGIDTIHCQD